MREEIDPLAVGDRVIRPRDLFEDRAVPTLRHGVVVEVYSDSASHVHQRVALYRVRWDDGEVGQGYLRLGLTREPINIGGLGL